MRPTALYGQTTSLRSRRHTSWTSPTQPSSKTGPGLQRGSCILLRIIVEDLEITLTTDSPSLGASLSFQSWSRLLEQPSAGDLSADAVLPTQIDAPDFQYWGFSPYDVKAYVTEETFCISRELTEMLPGTCHQALRTEVQDILLVSLLRAFQTTLTDRDLPKGGAGAFRRHHTSRDI